MYTRIVAEIGCNHKGDPDIAHQMIKIAANFCKVPVIKFQKRNPRELLSETQYRQPHPNPDQAYGKTYGEHREFLEFSAVQHRQLKLWCEEEGVTYSSSVWDLTSAREIAALRPSFIKIPSAANTNLPMLDWLCDNFSGALHVSLGMTTEEEEEKLRTCFECHGRLKDLVLYVCTSGYPVPFEDLHLLEITRIRRKFGPAIQAVGFSGHHLGIAADIAAVTLGARWIERHFTLDRTWKGTDHAASLEPDGLRRLVRDVAAVEQGLKRKTEEILPIERPEREKLKWHPISKSSH